MKPCSHTKRRPCYGCIWLLALSHIRIMSISNQLLTRLVIHFILRHSGYIDPDPNFPKNVISDCDRLAIIMNLGFQIKTT